MEILSHTTRKKDFSPSSIIDLKIIWVTLLFLNVKIGGVYSITIITFIIIGYFLVKNFKIRSGVLAASICLWFLTAIGTLSYIESVEPAKYVLNFFQIFVYAEYFKRRLSLSPERFFKLLNFMRLTLVFYLLSGFYEFQNGGFLWFESRNYDEFLPRINLGFGDANSLAGFLVLSIPIVFHSSLLTILLISIGALTFSRAFLISIIFFLGNYIVRLERLSVFVFIILAISVAIFFFDLSSLKIEFILDRLFEIAQNGDNPRLDVFRASLTGVSLLPDWSIFSSILDPHNSFLLATQLFGILGLVPFTILCFLIVLRIPSHKRDGFCRAIGLSISSFIVFSLFNSELFSVRNTVALGILLGIRHCYAAIRVA